ncbi:RelA/SpoT domain-containing protein [Magnetofaba australis]|uniref:RelA/SpoT domain-containing protein n=1 Tax=Magnetofaba australis TaxID=1472297 RepID=UPI000A19C868|nr:RelA/SpoT domain-containing protein [Magnetofaba australis]
MDINSIIDVYKENSANLESFMTAVETYFRRNEKLISDDTIYTIKSRMKDPEHLRSKVTRKAESGAVINENNIFTEITDLSGVRIIHLYPGQFIKIHQAIMSQIENNEWALNENPTGYTWDHETAQSLEELNIEVKLKPSFYTSVHYVVKPREDAKWCCEIQVRTLFEEIWGEIDHSVNYPVNSSDKIVRDQLKILARLVSTGSRLAESIYKMQNGVT